MARAVQGASISTPSVSWRRSPVPRRRRPFTNTSSSRSQAGCTARRKGDPPGLKWPDNFPEGLFEFRGGSHNVEVETLLVVDPDMFHIANRPDMPSSLPRENKASSPNRRKAIFT